MSDIPRILLTGPPRAGKTTVIMRAVGTLDSGGRAVRGFFTEEVRGKTGRIGFDLVSIADGARVPLARVDSASQVRVSRYGVQVANVAEFAVPAMAPGPGLVVVDEIGTMELACADFEPAVCRLLDSQTPVLGTVRAKAHPVCDAIKRRPDVDIVHVENANRDDLAWEIAARYSG